MRLLNKVVLITGAASGIGKESASLFAKEGAKVIVADINESLGKLVVKEIIKSGGEAIFKKVNIIEEEEVKIMIKEIIDEYDRIDVLFNNAGISGVGVLHELDNKDWKKVIDVNINGLYLVTKHVVPHMIIEKKGSIVNMSSCIAEIGLANRAVYAASKGAIYSLTKSMQVDYAPYNVRVNALMPGTIYTPFVEKYINDSPNPDATKKSVKKRQLSNDFGQPLDVAYAALYLASDESRFMMGAPLMIDGGTVNGK